jgi:hypothetical protein
MIPLLDKRYFHEFRTYISLKSLTHYVNLFTGCANSVHAVVRKLDQTANDEIANHFFAVLVTKICMTISRRTQSPVPGVLVSGSCAVCSSLPCSATLFAELLHARTVGPHVADKAGAKSRVCVVTISRAAKRTRSIDSQEVHMVRPRRGCGAYGIRRGNISNRRG